MIKKKTFKTKKEALRFLKDMKIDIRRIVLIAEKMNSCELIYK